jgi:tetratricopeptide (TPR) repeat protein
MKTFLSFATLVWLLQTCLLAHAQSPTSALQLQQAWDHANFEIKDKKQRKEALETLADTARQAMAQSSNDAAVYTWAGIIISTYAGEAGLSALKLVKEARSCFEQALNLDEQGTNGSAYTSLGSLYYQVPGWPLSFGNDKKAREMLSKGLEINPNGIDANYFYADFLMHEKDYEEAAVYFQRVLNAPPRPGRAAADASRKKQAREKLDEVRKKIS